jgi:hypothetical protein
MSSINLGIRTSECGCTGAAAGSPITVSGIKSGDTLLWIVKHRGATAAAGLNPGDFVVSNGAIQSSTVSTANFQVCVCWSPA